MTSYNCRTSSTNQENKIWLVNKISSQPSASASFPCHSRICTTGTNSGSCWCRWTAWTQLVGGGTALAMSQLPTASSCSEPEKARPFSSSLSAVFDFDHVADCQVCTTATWKIGVLSEMSVVGYTWGVRATRVPSIRAGKCTLRMQPEHSLQVRSRNYAISFNWHSRLEFSARRKSWCELFSCS